MQRDGRQPSPTGEEEKMAKGFEFELSDGTILQIVPNTGASECSISHGDQDRGGHNNAFLQDNRSQWQGHCSNSHRSAL